MGAGCGLFSTRRVAWREAGLGEISVAVNLASPSFRRADLADEIAAVLSKSNLDPQMLELEVTESMLIQDVGATLKTLTQLRQLGVKLSIDDFGTGHSSLSYLRRFRADQIKIDRSFVSDITTSSEAAAITAIINLPRREFEY